LSEIFMRRIARYEGERLGRKTGEVITEFSAVLENLDASVNVEKFREDYFNDKRPNQNSEATRSLLESIGEKKVNLLAFFHDRLKVYLKVQGVTHDVIDACLAMPNNDDLTLLVNRANALQAFVKTDDGENLLQGYKRANNILAAEEKKDGVSYEGEPELKFAEADAEKALFAALDVEEKAISTAIETEDFAAAMAALANLRAPIDAFFDGVQVNAEAQIVRRNRLCLLNRIRVVMHKVAIFSALNG